MASYKDTILADTPAAYYRLDMVGPATNGDVIPDLSGNSLDAVLVYDPTPFSGGIPPSPEPYGFASPIETDAASREFYSWANVGSGGFYGTSRIRRATDTLLQPSGNLAVESWIRAQAGMFSSAMVALTGTSDCGVAWLFSGGERLGGYIVDSAGTTWTVFDPSFDFTDYFGSSFHVFVKRTGNALSLEINGTLRATTTITSGLPTRTSASDFFIGHPSNLHFHQERIDEVAFYNFAPSAGTALRHYEAAKASLPMYATINARSSVVADLTPPPVYATFPYSHNFENPIIERLSRPTAVQIARDGREERAGRATKTRRTIRHQIEIMDARARRQFAALLRYNQRLPVAWPISQYESLPNAPITAGDTVIDVDTDLKDFDPDSRALIFTSEFDFEQVEIESLDPLTTKSPIESDWPTTAKIVPLKLAYLEQDLKLVGHTSELQESELTVSILVEDILDAPNRITPYTPAYTYRDVEVFDPRVWGLSNYEDPLDHDSVQQSELLDAQTGIFRIDSDAGISQPGFAYNLELWDRETIAKFLGWFEERAGRLKNLWVPTFQEDFKLVSMTGSTITVKETNYQGTYNLDSHSRDICLIQNDGTLAFRRINSVAPSGSNEVLTVSSSVSALASTTHEICFLRMCRLDADELELAWWTDNMVSVALRFREVLNEIS